MYEYIENFNKFIIFIIKKTKYILISLIQFIFLESLKEKKISLYNCINNSVDFFINKPVRYFIFLFFIFLIFIYILFYNKFIYNFFDNNRSYDLLKSNDDNYYTNKISEIEYNYNKSNILSYYDNDSTYYKFCLFILSFISLLLILLFYFLNTRTHSEGYGFYKDKDNEHKHNYLFYLYHDNKKNTNRGKYDVNLFNTLSIFFKCILIGILLFFSIVLFVSFVIFLYKFFDFAHNLYINIIIIIIIFTFVSFLIYLSDIFKQFITDCTNGTLAVNKTPDLSSFSGIFNILLNFLKSLTCTFILIIFFIPCIIYLLVNKFKYELKITLPITYLYFFIILILFFVLFLYNKYSNVLKNNSIFNPKVSYNLLNYDYYNNQLQEPVYIKKYIKLKNFNTILNIPDNSLKFFENKTYEHLIKKYLHKFIEFINTPEGFVESIAMQDPNKNNNSNQVNNISTSTEYNDKIFEKFEETKKYIKDFFNDIISGNYIEKNIGKTDYQIYNYVINTINNYEINFELYINANHNNNNNEIQILNFCKRPIISYKNNDILFYFYGYKFPIDNDLNYKDPSFNTDLPTYYNTNHDHNIDMSYNLYNLFTLKNIKFNKFNKFDIKYDGTYISIYLNNKLIFNNKFKLHIIDMQDYSIINNNISIGNNIIDISNSMYYNDNIELLQLNGLEAQIKNFNYKH
tara:strand:+ start:5097 stop:7154 length:2058 start_codon:yes stop_codon:yes gene_type:complete